MAGSSRKSQEAASDEYKFRKMSSINKEIIVITR